MSRKVDPVRKAIDAFVALSDEERRAFKAALAMHAALSAEVPAMEKRGPGRPRGSKNHSDAAPVLAVEVKE
jgi:hypothetical protein